MNIGGIAASAMNAFGSDMLVRAHNIANMSTPEYKSENIALISGIQDMGVVAGTVYTNVAPGPPVPGLVGVNEIGRGVLSPGYLEGSNTDIAREYAHMIGTQNAYAAMATTVRAHDDFVGMLLDLKV